MIAGDLAPADLPGAWAEGLQQLLGIAPANDREGCLQDIHWYDGDLGLFSDLHSRRADRSAAVRSRPRALSRMLLEAITQGEFAPLLGWLRERVHAKGSLLSTAELVESATGRPLGTAGFERHLHHRYLD